MNARVAHRDIADVVLGGPGPGILEIGHAAAAFGAIVDQSVNGEVLQHVHDQHRVVGMGVADDEPLDRFVPRRMAGKNLIDVADEVLPVDLAAGMFAGVFTAGVDHDEARIEFDQSGGSLAAPAEGFYVKGAKGPLLEGEIERAAVWAKSIQQQQ